MLTDFLKAAQTEVDNHSIYVLGGGGLRNGGSGIVIIRNAR